MKLKRLLYLLLFLTSISCSQYQKVLKSTDLDFKFAKAKEYYNEQNYNKAFPLFDELLSLYRGTSKAEEVYYYYASTTFHRKDYILAAYHYKNFTKTFPASVYSDECAFQVGYCYYLEAPGYSLDQTYTYKAMNEIQLYVNTHPNSIRLQECNEIIIELRRRLERKSFEKAQLYFKTEHFQSAVVAYNNTLNDFPDTKYLEEALYYRLIASYKLAENSIETKSLQRFIESQTAYFDYINKFPGGEKAEDANLLYEEIRKQINNYKF